jgi:hypothetical protein
MNVPTWDGNRNGMDIYKIPQPIPVDIKYTVAIVCNRMREINKFNQNIMRTFASRQAYQVIKGHYIPIINDSISDESVMDIEKRKYYIQKYDFTMMGFLLDEDDFEVAPAISRVFQMYEVDSSPGKKKQRKPIPNPPQEVIFHYPTGVTEFTKVFEYTANLTVVDTDNMVGWQVYINGDLYGYDLNIIQINTNDVLYITATKNWDGAESSITFSVDLL